MLSQVWLFFKGYRMRVGEGVDLGLKRKKFVLGLFLDS